MSLRALLFRRPPDPQLIEIAFDGATYPVELKRHAQARRYTCASAPPTARSC